MIRRMRTLRTVAVYAAVAACAALVTSVACAPLQLSEGRKTCTWDGTAVQRGTALSADADPDIAVTVRPLDQRLQSKHEGTGAALFGPFPIPVPPTTKHVSYPLTPLLAATLDLEARKAGYTFDFDKVYVRMGGGSAVYPHIIASEEPLIAARTLLVGKDAHVTFSFRARLEPEAEAEFVLGGLSYEGRTLPERHFPLARGQFETPCGNSEVPFFMFGAEKPILVRACRESSMATAFAAAIAPASAPIWSVELDTEGNRIVLWSGGVPRLEHACANGNAPRLLDGERLVVDMASGTTAETVCLEEASRYSFRRLADGFRWVCGQKPLRVRASSRRSH